MGNVLLLSLMLVGAAAAQNEGDQSCSQCGCGARPKKICRLKVGEGTATKTEFDVKYEDYCIPGHSKCCGFRWIRDQCGYRSFYKVPIWQAACGCVKKRKYLVRVPKTSKVPTYTCVVETVCCSCGHAEIDEDATTEARANEIMPASFDQPIILDAGELPPHAAVDTGAAVSTTHGQQPRRLADE